MTSILASDTFAADVLRLLVLGATHGNVAARFHVSLPTVDAQVARLRRSLAATTPYSLGVQIIRRRMLDHHIVISHARTRAVGSHWIEPSTRQLSILRLLARGLDDEASGRAIGRSARTVRREVAHLATANGVHGRTSAGALFEALAWHC